MSKNIYYVSNVQSELFPNLIITFNLNRTFPSRECFKKEIPLVSFIDDACDFSFIDYPIFINLCFPYNLHV